MLQSKKRKSDDQSSSSSTSDTYHQKNNSDDPQHIKDREEFEAVRIDALYKIDEERKRNQQKRRELDALEKREQVVDPQTGDSVGTNGKVKEILQSGENIVKLMVGGKMFVTSLSTINKRDNMIKTMLNSDFKVDTDENGCILLSESNPDYFPIILEHIRTGSTNYVGLWEVATDDNIDQLKSLLLESDFFATSKLSSKIAKLIKEYSSHKKVKQVDEMVDEDEPITRVSEQTTLDTNQKESDEKWLEQFSQLTLKEKSLMEEFLKKTEDELEKEREELRKREASLKKEPITFNVRGVKFIVSVEKLLVHSDSIFPQLVLASSNNEIFLDRDSDIFSVLFEYIESGTFKSVPKEISKRKLLYKEAKEFKIKGVLEFLDPLRYPVEDIGVENLQIKKDEDFLRHLLVTDRENPILDDPYIHLVGVFGKDNCTRDFLEHADPPSTVPLLFDFENPVEASELINEHSKLKLPSIPKCVSTREEFFVQFNALTCGIFKDMDWNNCFCAGGGILACILKAELERKDLLLESHYFTPPPTIEQAKKKLLWEEDDGSESENDQPNTDGYYTATSSDNDTETIGYNFKRKMPPSKHIQETASLDQEIFNYYQKSYWKNSDIDLFIYGLNEKEAENKIIYLYNLFKKNLVNIPSYARSEEKEHTDILLIRTENAITFKFITSVRSVQVILRIYKNPAEVLIGFDVNSCCVGFDGNQVYALPRAIQAIKTRCNIIDIDRQSTTYEIRLVKYAMRGFRIGCCGFDEKKLQNDDLIKDHFYRPSKRYRWKSSQHTAKLSNVTGLAKILLIRHSYKHSKFKGCLGSIGAGRSLESAEKIISKSKLHDYTQIKLPRYNYGRSYITSANQVFAQIQNRTEYLVEEVKKKLFFEYSLNDLDEIISPKSPKSDLPPHLVWITYEPTRQYVVGSFYPHKNNFFKDAYTDDKTESKASGKKKLCKYKWSMVGRRYRKAINAEESKLVEEAYRKFKKSPTKKENNTYILNDGKTINFHSMQVTMDKSTTATTPYWGYRTYRAERTRDSHIFVKSEVTLTDIHEVLAEDISDDEVKEIKPKKEAYTTKKIPKPATSSKKTPSKIEYVSSDESSGSSEEELAPKKK